MSSEQIASAQSAALQSIQFVASFTDANVRLFFIIATSIGVASFIIFILRKLFSFAGLR